MHFLKSNKASYNRIQKKVDHHFALHEVFTNRQKDKVAYTSRIRVLGCVCVSMCARACVRTYQASSKSLASFF